MDLIEQLDELFSKLTRLVYADWKGEVKCYTCSWRGPWKEADAGHFIRRGIRILRWERDNVRVQCQTCNRLHGGMPATFEEELREELGDERVDELKGMTHDEMGYDEAWMLRTIAHTKTLVRQAEVRHA